VTHIPAPPTHIEFAGISKAYPNGVQALQDIDLTIRQGEIFGIIGRSGAGKSTLLRLFNRLENADSGEMFIHGESTVRYSTRQLRDLRRRVAMIFQHFNLMATKTVAQNIALPLKMAGVPAGERQRRVSEMLELVGLSALRDSYPARLPAARNSGPASPGRWSLSRKFCCAMRQPRRWIRKTPCRC
jgi:D-methionine transport system ATP-binding protein